MLRVDRVAQRNPVVGLEPLVVRLDPLHPCPLRLERQREAQAAGAVARRLPQRLGPRTGDPQRRMRLLERHRPDAARRQREVLALEPAEAAVVLLVGEHLDDGVQRLVPLLFLGLDVDAEAAELARARALAGAELRPAVREEVEPRDPLGHPERAVDLVGQRDDPVAEADVGRALGSRREEHLRRAAVRVLLEEVMLGGPRRVEPEPVGELDLLERLVVLAVLGLVVPGTRHLQQEEQPELHLWPSLSVIMSMCGTARPAAPSADVEAS